MLENGAETLIVIQPGELNQVADQRPFSSSLKGCVAIREPSLRLTTY